MPKPKKRRSKKAGDEQQDLALFADDGISSVEQEYNPTPIINDIRSHLKLWRAISNISGLGLSAEQVHDLGPTNSAVFLKSLARLGVGFSCFEEIEKIEKAGNRKAVTLRHVLTGESRVRTVDHCVVERGLTPNDRLFFALKPKSINRGQVDHQALINGGSAFGEVQFGEEFVLARIGDAIAGRNIHAAVLDAIRTCKDL